jgi:formylglycine-generating enzyme required for sulfatase activity
MRFPILFAISFACIAVLPSCSKKPVEVTGQIFVITQGRENIKMGGVKVLMVPDDEFRKKAQDVVGFMQQEAQAEAQRRADSDHMTQFIHEVIALEGTGGLNLPELPKIRERIVKESDMASKLVHSLNAGDLLTRSFVRLFADHDQKLEFTTDADGKFALPLKGKAWFHAMAERKVGENSEGYLWIKSFEAPDGVTTANLVISNEDDIDDEDGLYAMLAAACELQGELAEFRKVEVSEKMKSMVARYRDEVESAKSKAEREAAEASEKFRGNRAGEEREIEIAPGVNMTFCWCPAGTFKMGSPSSEEHRSSDEDQVDVTLTKGFWMAKTEVTQAQWRAVMGTSPSRFEGDLLPVETVSWNDCQEFLKKLNAMVSLSDGGQMQLPTEAQWEYACRAGETGPHPGGGLNEIAWHDGNSENRTHQVGTKRPNAWGLHDMIGNVWEWCGDWYDEDLASGTDPKGPSSGSYRVYRGGSWNFNAIYCRAAYRFNYDPGYSNYNFGFRVARSSVP